MPEATILCCDTSEWMRNGDFSPNRFEAQKEACNIVCGAKTQQNRENEVGLIQMGGKGKAVVLRNCTTEVGMIWNAAHKMEIKGKADILIALQTAQLALKHRKNKKQSQRIIVFIGSPVVNKKKDLIKAAKRLKKNKVAVDIVSFGETDANDEVLTAFMEKVNSNGNSHLISVARGFSLGDALITSPICVGEGGAATQLGGSGAVGAAGSDFPGGIDPNMDPDLAMALRLSLEEERERQREQAKATGSNPQGDASAPTEATIGDQQAAAASEEKKEEDGDMDVEDEDEALARAIAMSMNEEDTKAAPEANGGETEKPVVATAEAIAKPSEAETDAALDNPEFIDDLLGDLPGMDRDEIDMEELLDMVDDDTGDAKKDEKGD